MLEKIDGWIWGILGVIGVAIGSFFVFFFKSFYDRLAIAEKKIDSVDSKAQKEIATIKTEVKDFRSEVEKVMSIQQTQNTREHDKLEKNTAEKIASVGKSLGQSLDVMREIQNDMVKDIKDILKSKAE